MPTCLQIDKIVLMLQQGKQKQTGADAALTMRAYSLPCTWEHQWTWSLFSSRNLVVSLILSSSPCDHIISLRGDPALCLLTTESSKPINCVIMTDQSEVIILHSPFYPKLSAIIVHIPKKKKKKRMKGWKREQPRPSNKQHKRFTCEGQRLTGLIALGVWGKPVCFKEPTGKSWAQTNCLLQREYCVGGYGNNSVLRACFTFCGVSATTWDSRTTRVAE